MVYWNQTVKWLFRSKLIMRVSPMRMCCRWFHLLSWQRNCAQDCPIFIRQIWTILLSEAHRVNIACMLIQVFLWLSLYSKWFCTCFWYVKCVQWWKRLLTAIRIIETAFLATHREKLVYVGLKKWIIKKAKWVLKGLIS